MNADLKRFLKALQRIKQTKHPQSTEVYQCFGCYDEHNSACLSQGERADFPLCRVCKRMTTIEGYGWIADALKEE